MDRFPLACPSVPRDGRAVATVRLNKAVGSDTKIGWFWSTDEASFDLEVGSEARHALRGALTRAG